MRKGIQIILVLILSITDLIAQSDNNKINEVLRKVELNIRNYKNISYFSYCEEFNSGIEDSISNFQGSISLRVSNLDSIFGSIFHLRGSDKIGVYDYFYDGTKSYEIRHNDKAVLIFDPYKYKNDANNPAKARMALIPFVKMLLDTNITYNLIKNKPIVSLIDNEDTYNIVFKYPANEFGEESKQLSINKQSFNIEKIKTDVLWNGVRFKSTIIIDSLIVNNLKNDDNIYLKNSYSDYAINEYKSQVNQPFISKFIGKEAKGFKLMSFNNDTIILNSLRGKNILLDFWESWCGHCIVKIPEIQKLADENRENLIVIGITTENYNQIQNIINRNKLTYINVFAAKKILSDYDVQGRPAYFLIDANGIIIEHTLGDLGTISLAIKRIQKH